MPLTVWGLDIGNSAIKAVKMVRNEDEIKIVDFDIVDLPESGEEEKETLPKIEAAMRTLTTNHKFGNDPVYISVAGGMCLHREFLLPPGSEAKLLDLVLYEVKQQIPFPIDQVEWGFERFEDPNGVGISMFAVRKSDIQDIIAMIQRLNLRLVGIIPASMALFNFVYYEFKPDNTTLILDAGAKSTDFVVMSKRQIFTRPIQIAGREITRVLENKFKVSFEKAEELKKNIAQSPQASKILGVIEPTLRQLGSEIQKTVGFYKSKAKGQRLNQCYLLGHTFRLPGMAETLQGLVREAPFAIVEGLQKIKLDYTVNADVWNNEFPTMAVAIGMGLQGLGASELILNLLPEELKQGQAIKSLKFWSAAAAALVLVTVGYTYVHATANANKYQQLLDRADEVDTSWRKYDVKEKQIVDALPPRKLLLERLSRVGRDRGKVLDSFNSLTGLANQGKLGPNSEDKIMLTGLYISRAVPVFTANMNATQSATPLPDIERDKIKHETLDGASSVYSYLAKGPTPKSLPLELRPEPPIVVVLSGEYDNSGGKGNGPLTSLQNTLQAIKGVSDIHTENNKDTSIPGETPLIYTYEGALSKNVAPSGQPVASKAFHLVFRWNTPDDPDNVPIEQPAAAADKGAKK